MDEDLAYVERPNDLAQPRHRLHSRTNSLRQWQRWRRLQRIVGPHTLRQEGKEAQPSTTDNENAFAPASTKEANVANLAQKGFRHLPPESLLLLQLPTASCAAQRHSSAATPQAQPPKLAQQTARWRRLQRIVRLLL